MSRVTTSPELAECIQSLRAILKARLQIVNSLIGVTVQHPATVELRRGGKDIPDSLARVLPPMLQALGSSCNTLVELSDAPGLQTRDCFSIARSIVELGVNICYIIAVGEDAAERAIRHSRQKAYRDLERESTIGESTIRLVFSGRVETTEIPGLDDEIAEFTARSGREKGWVDGSLDERINTIAAHIGGSVLSDLHFARFMIYRHSSEILHGTLFGVQFVGGATYPSKQKRTLEELYEIVGDHHMMILMAAGCTVSAVTTAFHARFHYPELQRRSQDLWDKAREIPHFRAKLSSFRPPESA